MANASSGSHATPDAQADSSAEDAKRERERALVERAQAGDQRAFRELYLLHSRAVFRCGIMPLVRDRDLAEDLLSETFVRALRNIAKFQWRDKGLLPWLIRIAKNLCLDHLRKSGRVSAWPEGFEQQIPDLSDSDAEALLGRAELANVLSHRIEACMDDLNPRYRRVLQLRMIEKRSRQEAAATMEVTIGTLDVLLFRACKSFRKVYTERFGTSEGPLFS